jgi:hypothetical protein
MRKELTLWRSVLLVGLQEAARDRDWRWLGSDDFQLVCALAGVEAEAVLRFYNPARFADGRVILSASDKCPEMQ